MHRHTRQILRMVRRVSSRIESPLDREYPDPAVPRSTKTSHGRWLEHLRELANKPGMRVLEIGSREVTGSSSARAVFGDAEYVGFDIYAGRNVDVVGDAHRLSEYFGPDERFDLIYSSATFEHFAMPWVVAREISSMLRVGGHVFVESHFSYSSHERPWHFFQFSDMAMRVLFSPALGIECVEAGVSNPIIGRFSAEADDYLRFRPVTGLYCHTEFLGMKVRDVAAFSWEDVDLADVVGRTVYPAPDAGEGDVRLE